MKLIAWAAALAVAVVFLRRRWHRFPRGRERDAAGPITIPLGLAMILLMYVLGPVGAYFLSQFQPPPPEDSPPEQRLAWQTMARLAAYALQLLVVVWYARVWAAWPRSDRDRRRPGAVHAAVLGAATLALWYPAMYVTGIIAAFAQEKIQGAPVQAIAHATLKELAESEAGLTRWMTILLAVLAAPIIEETMYRGLLQRTLAAAGQGPWVRIVLTSMVFALFHINVAQPYALAALFVLSLGFGWVFERTGRIIAPIAMHMVFNALNVILLFTMPAS